MTEAGLIAYKVNGTVLLIRLADSGCQVVGQFRVDYGRDQHWTTPVVANGRLFIHHGNALAAFDIREKP